MVKYSSNLNKVFYALKSPVRRSILSSLSKETLTVAELSKSFKISAPAVSKHLRVLDAGGLLTRRKIGRKVLCSVNPSSLKDAKAWLDFHSKFWNKSFDNLGRYLKKNLK